VNRYTRFFSLLLAVSSLSTVAAAQQEVAPVNMNKDQVKAVIEEYIKDNPDVIIQSLKEFEVRQRQEEEAAQNAKLEDHKAYFDTADLPRVGNPAGDIKIVEFYDYNCGYCKRAFDDLNILLEADPNVQVILVDMPILGESSLESAKWSAAAAKDPKFFEYHTAIMKFGGPKNEANLRTLAESSGLDADKLKAALNDQAIIDRLEKNIEIARDIGIRGTPGFVINGDIYRGYLGYDGMKAVIDEIRLSNKPAPAGDTPEIEESNIVPDEEEAPADNVNE